MQRIALGIEYDGANYSGWQRQRHKSSIQEQLEKAISVIANDVTPIFCAGRTDAGVHASGQVIHFDVNREREDHVWIRGVNAHLPADIRVLWSKRVINTFDARRSALSRRYCFIIINRSVSPGILNRSMTWVMASLDVTLMQEGAQYLLGNHDFSAFRAAQCQAKSAIRTLHSLKVQRYNEYVVIDITANAFLHHMVRNIAGSLIAVGQKKYTPRWIEEVLHSKDRRCAGITAPPHGLYLVQVNYPDHFEIPTDATSFWFSSIT